MHPGLHPNVPDTNPGKEAHVNPETFIPSQASPGSTILFPQEIDVTALNVAVTLFAAFIVNVQLPVPEHAPLQPTKVELEAALAVKVTDVPEI